MEVTIGSQLMVIGFLYLLMAVLVIIYSRLLHSMSIKSKESNTQLAVYQLKCSEQQSQLRNLDYDYEYLRKLNESFEKFSEEAGRLYIVEQTEKRAQELIERLNLLDDSLAEMQKQHQRMFQKQQKLHRNLLREHELLNEYFKNYS